MPLLSYSGYRFPPDIIQRAVWMYLRFTLSFRDVEELLAERGNRGHLRECPPMGPHLRPGDRTQAAGQTPEAAWTMAPG